MLLSGRDAVCCLYFLSSKNILACIKIHLIHVCDNIHKYMYKVCVTSRYLYMWDLHVGFVDYMISNRFLVLCLVNTAWSVHVIIHNVLSKNFTKA